MIDWNDWFDMGTAPLEASRVVKKEGRGEEAGVIFEHLRVR